MLSANNIDLYLVINKLCAREVEYMSLISWTHPRGSEQLQRPPQLLYT
jgi:hypothetical protein